MKESTIAPNQMTDPASRPKEESSLPKSPWLALVSLLIVLICVGASASIIVVSNKRTVASWRVQPAVLLAILSSVSNFALGTAFSIGIVVTWWRSAVKGASLKQLHYIWDRGEGISFFSAFAAGGNARKVILAAFFIAVVKFVNNPLLQRATRQRVEEIVVQETIRLNVVQNLPEGWFGAMINASAANMRGSAHGIATAQSLWRNDTIQSLDAPGYYCDGTCEGNVPGAGISYICSSTTQALDLLTGKGTVVFAINTTISQNSTGAPLLRLTTVHSSAIDDNCTATLTIDTCDIEAGIVEYPITIQNSTVTLNSDELNNATVLSKYVCPGDLHTAAPETPAGILQGLHGFLGHYLKTNSTVVKPSVYSGFSMLPDMFYQTEPSSYSDYTFKTCHLKWSSPTKFVLNSMQDFMFRAAFRASNGTEVQTFAVLRTSPTQVFHSDYGYLAAAMIITLLGLLGVLFMLQGWWVLGRAVSLSPLETAKAFCAPLMGHTGHKLTVDELLGDIGHVWVQYVDGVMVYDNDVDKEGQGHHGET